ncbi:MAG: 4Fe-4S binding protein [Clostridiales bacterium]|nr:4Fe-4S binding protein [Clostridiales bacterium]
MKWIETIIRLVFLALFLLIITGGNMMIWLGLFAVTLIGSIFFGRFYCGYICPMNTVMIPADWISRKLKIQNANPPKWLKNGVLPWVFLGITIVVMILFKKALQINIPILLVWLAISFLVTLIYKPEVFHNHICPFGVMQKTFGKYGRFSKQVDESACIGCKKCESVCQSNAITIGHDNKASINTALCHQCNNCSLACPTDAIKFTRVK